MEEISAIARHADGYGVHRSELPLDGVGVALAHFIEQRCRRRPKAVRRHLLLAEAKGACMPS